MKPLCWTLGHPLTLVERTSPQTQHMRCTQCGSHYGRHSDLNGWGAYLLPWESVREFYEAEQPDGYYWPDRPSPTGAKDNG